MIAAAAALLVDQGAKWLILYEVMQPPRAIPVLPFLTLRLGFNTGVSFGMFSGFFAESPYALASLTALIVGFLWFMVWRSRSAFEAAGLGLMIGGASGNIADRLRLGAVVDFIDLHYAGWSWPAFNTADMAIFSGVVLLLIAPAIERRRKNKPADFDDPPHLDDAGRIHGKEEA